MKVMKSNDFDKNPPIAQAIRLLLPDFKMDSESCIKYLEKNIKCTGCPDYPACKRACYLLESYTLWGKCIEIIKVYGDSPASAIFKDLANFCITAAAYAIEGSNPVKEVKVDMTKLFESLN